MFWFSYEQQVKTVTTFSYFSVNNESRFLDVNIGESSDFSATKWIWSSLFGRTFSPKFLLSELSDIPLLCLLCKNALLSVDESLSLYSKKVLINSPSLTQFESKNLPLDFRVMVERLSWLEETSLYTGSRSYSGSSSRILSSSSWSAVDVTEVLSRKIRIILQKSAQCCLLDRFEQVKAG